MTKASKASQGKSNELYWYYGCILGLVMLSLSPFVNPLELDRISTVML